MTSKAKPPFRADHVGSLLRPDRLREARDQREKGTVSASELRAIEDDCIREVVELQEGIGLLGVTDGEYRRTFWHLDFLEQIDGVKVTEGAFAASFRRDDGVDVNFKPPTMTVGGRLNRTHSIQTEDFRFLKSAATATPKVSIPSPSMLHFRGGREAIDKHAYPEMAGFYADLARVYNEEILELAAMGARYIQIDDTNFTYLCDQRIRTATQNIGEDPDELPRTYCKLINDSTKGRPDDMAVCVHMCRGNFRSAWVAEGGYEPVAEVLFNELDVDGYFLEYDDHRSGDFAPLRFVPKDKTVVLGLVTSKTPTLEPKDELKRRIDDASKYVSVDQLAISPQCGFSSTVHGNDLTIDDQIAKLRLIVEVAEDVWGSV